MALFERKVLKTNSDVAISQTGQPPQQIWFNLFLIHEEGG
jgi:hypothetical protein